MTFLAILLALLLEQARPLGQANPVYDGIRSWSEWVRRTVDAGQPLHGWLAWGLVAVVPAALALLVWWGLSRVSDVLAFLWLVAMLYLTLGFRQFSHHFTSIREALESGDELRARAELAAWQEVAVDQLPRHEVLRHVIEHSVVAAHRHVFGVLACFVVFAALGLGPAGAVLYRMAEHVARRWRSPVGSGHAASAQAARTAWQWLDVVPVRVTALGFAVVGNFEEALANWRQDARLFTDPNDGVLLAATAGALNVRLGGQPLGATGPSALPGTDGRLPQLAHLGSVVGLVWRSVVLWMTLLGLGVLARWV